MDGRQLDGRISNVSVYLRCHSDFFLRCEVFFPFFFGRIAVDLFYSTVAVYSAITPLSMPSICNFILSNISFPLEKYTRTKMLLD